MQQSELRWPNLRTASPDQVLRQIENHLTENGQIRPAGRETIEAVVTLIREHREYHQQQEER